jgi:hypothetical protein
MADEIRNGDSKVRVVRLLGHRDDAGAWQIPDFLKRSVVESQWIELSTEEDCRRELGLSDLNSALSPSPGCGSTTSRSTVRVRLACPRPCTPPRKV